MALTATVCEPFVKATGKKVVVFFCIHHLTLGVVLYFESDIGRLLFGCEDGPPGTDN